MGNEWFFMMNLVAEELNEKVQHGVYQRQNGPCYETIAEMRMAKSYGADALGMSTTYEGKYLKVIQGHSRSLL